MKFLSNLDLTKNQLLNAVIQTVSSLPSSPKVGQIVYKEGEDQQLYIAKDLNGTPEWVEVGVFYDISVVDDEGIKLRLTGNDGTTDDVLFTGSGAVTVSRTTAGGIEINVPTSLATEESLTLKFDGGTTANTDLYVFNGGTPRTIDFIGGTGITLAKAAGQITFNHSNSISSGTISDGGNARTLANGGAFNIPSVTFDAQGHITSTTTTALTLPTYAAGTYISLTGNTFDHDDTTRSDSTSSASPAFGATFTAVDSVTTNATGHVTAINVKTVTVPTETTLSITEGTSSTGVFVDDISVSDHAITVNRSNSTQNTVTVGELIVSKAGDKTGDVTIAGNLTVNGTTTTINTETVAIEDNIIEINSSQTGTPATSLVGGLEVNRGSEANFQLVFVEQTDDFRLGKIGALQPALTRDEVANLANNNLLVWDSTGKRAVGSTPQTLGIARKFAATYDELEPEDTITVTHNLGTQDVTYSIRAGNGFVLADVEIVDNNTIQINLGEINGITELKVVVIG